MGCGSDVKDAGQSIAHVVVRDFTVDVVQCYADSSWHKDKIVLHADGQSWRRTAASENAKAIDIMHAAALNSYRLVRTVSIFCPDPDTTAPIHLTVGPDPVYAAGRA